MTTNNQCRVCHRPLRNLVSIALGVGPVCRKKVAFAMQDMLERVRRGEAEPEYQEAYAIAPDDLQTLVEQDVRQAYLEQLRQGRRPSRDPITVQVESGTRGRNEEITVQWIDRDHARVTSASGNTYSTTEQACNCPDFTYRRSRNPDLAQEGCRHIQAMRLAREEISERRRIRNSRRNENVSPVEIHETNRITFSQIDWTEEAQREQVLSVWKRNKPFDGTFISRDERAWNQLKEEAEQDFEYKYENVLGGTGNSFGVEIEVEFDDQFQRQRAIQALYDEGILSSRELQPYHSSGADGFWKAERDGSLGFGGAEFVSPKLYDTPETWQQIEKLTSVLKQHGARVTSNCGGHIHLGIAPLDHRTYSWQRLSRIGVAYEKQFFRIGGADAESYRQYGRPGTHRGIDFTRPLPSNLSFSGNVSASTARRKLGNYTRRTMFNTNNIDRMNGRPAIEMRYPNSTLDHRQLQAQIQVANAVIHQAAVIRNDSPLSEFTPRFSERDQHLRYNQSSTEAHDENNFRRFLDVIGNKDDRLAATKLWLRGRS